MKQVLLALLFGFAFCVPALADAEVLFSDKERLKALFSYPNNCSEPCEPNQTLEETVRLYIDSSLKRDGYFNTTTRLDEKDILLFIDIDGDVPQRYGDELSNFFDIGDLAIAATEKMKSDGKWRDDWRMMLPLGLAIDRHKSVQVMHFPPIYVLTRDQDYLKARTTKRWADLLTRNGVAKDETDRYQTVIDVAPIGAPSNAGSELGESYDYFREYAKELIEDWSKPEAGTTQSRPLMAFGSPVRHWINDTYGLNLKNMETASITMTTGRTVEVFTANHPSLMWNRIERFVDLPNYCSF